MQGCGEVQKVFVDQTEYILSRNGMGAFCTVYACIRDDVVIDITCDAEYKSSDEAVVTVWNGMIRAEGKGIATVFVSYNDHNTSFSVTVEDEVDIEKLEREFLQYAGVSLSDNNSYEETLSDITSHLSGVTHIRSAQDILNKAIAMKNIEWTPTQKLEGWDHKVEFPKGVQVKGIPYSQDKQVDDIEFPKALLKNDFYSGGASANDGTFCPIYGVDCSRYVSYALGIDARTTQGMLSDLRNGTGEISKVGTYNVSSPRQADLLAAYSLADEGDALVHQGHAMLVVYNDKNAKEITVYETQIKLPIMSTYSYSYLAGKDYLPFEVK